MLVPWLSVTNAANPCHQDQQEWMHSNAAACKQHEQGLLDFLLIARCTCPSHTCSCCCQQAWVLDTVPAEVPTGAGGGAAGAALDHPRALIETLRQIPEPIDSRNQVLDFLLQRGEWAAPFANASHQQ